MSVAILWAVSFAVGIAWQVRSPASALVWNRRIFRAYFNFLAPVVILFAYSFVPADRATVSALAVVIVASWLVLGVGALYARLAARDRGEQGALLLGSGFTNTVTLGFPVSNALFGPVGLAYQVLFAQFMYLIPIISISTTIAAHFGNGTRSRTWGGILRQLLNVPLIVAGVAVLIRVVGFDISGVVERPALWVAWIMGPIGFFELGLALPLERPRHGVADLWRALGPLVIRIGVAPAVLLAIAFVAQVDIPHVFYVAVAMPAAFHTLILARVFALPGPMMRLIVVTSTVIVVGAVVGYLAIVD
jgi:predicted permease